jgi:hypothetical protein
MGWSKARIGHHGSQFRVSRTSTSQHHRDQADPTTTTRPPPTKRQSVPARTRLVTGWIRAGEDRVRAGPRPTRGSQHPPNRRRVGQRTSALSSPSSASACCEQVKRGTPSVRLERLNSRTTPDNGSEWTLPQWSARPALQEPSRIDGEKRLDESWLDYRGTSHARVLTSRGYIESRRVSPSIVITEIRQTVTNAVSRLIGRGFHLSVSRLWWGHLDGFGTIGPFISESGRFRRNTADMLHETALYWALVAHAVSVSSVNDEPGCCKYLDTNCTTQCCALHDQCYHLYGCTWTSFFTGLWTPECARCNSKVMDCLARCVRSPGRTMCGDLQTCYTRRCGGWFYCAVSSVDTAINLTDPISPSTGRLICPIWEPWSWRTCRCEGFRLPAAGDRVAVPPPMWTGTYRMP